MGSLFTNKLGVIFTPAIDEQNNWKTIVMNPITEELFEIDKIGYFILKKIEDNPGIMRQELGGLEIYSFIEQMVKENVIIEK